MLTGKELGAAIQAAISKKGVTKAAMARDFHVQPPSIQDWVKFGRIDKRHLPKLWEYFQDVVPPSHWGLSEPTVGNKPSPEQNDQIEKLIEGFRCANKALKKAMLLLAEQALEAKSQAEREIMTPAILKDADIINMVEPALVNIRFDFGGKIPDTPHLAELIALQIRRELEQQQKLKPKKKKEEV